MKTSVIITSFLAGLAMALPEPTKKEPKGTPPKPKYDSVSIVYRPLSIHVTTCTNSTTGL